METKTVSVKRFDAIVGVGARVYKGSTEAPQAASENDLLDVFTPTPSEAAVISANGQTAEDWKWGKVVAAVNEASVKDARAKLVSEQDDSGEVIESFKKAVYSFTVLLKGKSKAECAQMLLSQNDSLRQDLEAEGIIFGDVEAMRKKFHE